MGNQLRPSRILVTTTTQSLCGRLQEPARTPLLFYNLKRFDMKMILWDLLFVVPSLVRGTCRDFSRDHAFKT